MSAEAGTPSVASVHLQPPALRRSALGNGCLRWVGHCRPRTSAIRSLNLGVSFPAVRSLARPALADPYQPLDALRKADEDALFALLCRRPEEGRCEGGPLLQAAACARTQCRDPAHTPLARHGLRTPGDGDVVVSARAPPPQGPRHGSRSLIFIAKDKELTARESMSCELLFMRPISRAGTRFASCTCSRRRILGRCRIRTFDACR
jgi:hypothetical protein